MFRKQKECNCVWSAVAYVKTDINNGLSKAIQRVIELHKPDTHISAVCIECDKDYPCPTIQALEIDLQNQ